MTEPSSDPSDLDGSTTELYNALRDLARRAMSRIRGQLDPTDLVHQAWLRLSERFEGLTRAEFLALSATVMRRMAVDEARQVAVRGGHGARVTLAGVASEEARVAVSGPIDLLDLDQALDALREADERWARIVELRFFGGMTGEEVAEVLGLSRKTVTRDWALARAWLKSALTR